MTNTPEEPEIETDPFIVDLLNQAMASETGMVFATREEKNECTQLTGHLPGQDHRWQECPTYHDGEN